MPNSARQFVCCGVCSPNDRGSIGMTVHFMQRGTRRYRKKNPYSRLTGAISIRLAPSGGGTRPKFL
ncbi:hypothetical protein ZHAS_00021075 [Anopheles sinensis]|uniref:Uncharacterized protein n=1 Tax=Anopheles sinensis TaxID=74873 RepID=A0A084WRG3_ANOSI|nr:hypothetical protein ZHAS_00021075 [Anopheles sinensis]